MFSMAYLPSAQRLTVAIIKARKLKLANDAKNIASSYSRDNLTYIIIIWAHIFIHSIYIVSHTTIRDYNNNANNNVVWWHCHRVMTPCLTAPYSTNSKVRANHVSLLNKLSISFSAEGFPSDTATVLWHRVSLHEMYNTNSKVRASHVSLFNKLSTSLSAEGFPLDTASFTRPKSVGTNYLCCVICLSNLKSIFYPPPPWMTDHLQTFRSSSDIALAN